MRYFRALSVLAIVTALGLGAIALGRSPHASRQVQLHRAVQQAARQYVAAQPRLFPPLPNVVPPQFRKFTPPLVPYAPATGGTTCYVATSCSITPCVIPVAGAVAGVPNAAARCPLGDRTPQKVLPVTAR